MKTWTRLAQWTALPLAILVPLSAADKGITKQQADEILNELKQIRQLLEKQQGNRFSVPVLPALPREHVQRSEEELH
jgi:hypothetical protein